jgi:mannose/cellobiose epimerase-like protein (N-acyl-D-glucosamine 2-epimerase family)
LAHYAFSHFQHPQVQRSVPPLLLCHVTRVQGEWLGYLHRDGSPSSTLKGNMWKSFFHHPRALLMCMQLCADMPQ